MHMDIGPHIADDVLEKYLLNRLAEAESAPVEEHLLVCTECQTKAEEMQEFILVAKTALRDAQKKPAARSLHAASGVLHSWFTLPIVAAVVAAVAAAIFLPSHHARTSGAPVQVHLYAMRGAETAPVRVHAGSNVILDLDATGLPADNYAVRVVDSQGTTIWSGAGQTSGNEVRAELPATLEPGRYWVRLTRRGASVREYGLTIE